MKYAWLEFAKVTSSALLVWTSIFLGATATAQEKPATAAIDPLDWPYWRGPEYNSISRETGLPDTINPDGGEGSNLAWKRADLGGRSTPIVRVIGAALSFGLTGQWVMVAIAIAILVVIATGIVVALAATV